MNTLPPSVPRHDFNLPLTRRVAEALFAFDPEVCGALDVVAYGDSVRLRGLVYGESKREQIIERVRTIAGVGGIVDELRVRAVRSAPPRQEVPLAAPPAADPWWQRAAGPTYLVAAVAAILIWRYLPAQPDTSRDEPLIAAQGTLYVDGRPADGAELEFWPLHVASGSQPRPTAVTDVEGRYRVTTGTSEIGAPPGIYAVTVRRRPPTVRGEELVVGDDTLPARFAAPNTTPLRVEILPGHARHRLPTLHLAVGAKPLARSR